MGTEEQRNSGYRGTEEQWVQRNTGYRGTEEHWVQRNGGTAGTILYRKSETICIHEIQPNLRLKLTQGMQTPLIFPYVEQISISFLFFY